MAITRFRPEIWAAELLVALRKALVYGGPMVVNRDYEGDIEEAGDTVRITSISDPTIGTYTANSTTVTAEELTDAQRTLVVDQAKYFAFYVDDVDKRQAKGDVLTEAMRRAAYKIRDQIDQYVVSLYTGAQSANQVGTVAVPTGTPTALYDSILVPLKVKLDEANVPTEGRFCVVPPWLHGRGLRDDRFVRADASGSTNTLRNGVVGEAAGFTIMMSNNAPLVTGDDYLVLAGTNAGISYAEQINKTEAYRPEAKFADAVKGLTLYGAKLVRPDVIATAIASQT